MVRLVSPQFLGLWHPFHSWPWTWLINGSDPNPNHLLPEKLTMTLENQPSMSRCILVFVTKSGAHPPSMPSPPQRNKAFFGSDYQYIVITLLHLICFSSAVQLSILWEVYYVFLLPSMEGLTVMLWSSNLNPVQLRLKGLEKVGRQHLATFCFTPGRWD